MSLDNINIKFNESKKHNLFAELLKLFLAYEKTITSLENKIVFLDYLDYLIRYRVDKDTLKELIAHHRTNVESGHFFPKINQLLTPLILKEKAENNQKKETYINDWVNYYTDILLRKLNGQPCIKDDGHPIKIDVVDKFIMFQGGINLLRKRTQKSHMFLMKEAKETFTKEAEKNYIKKVTEKNKFVLLK